jgi:hypothetical protein
MGVLISCATPDASWPTDRNFCARRSRDSICSRCGLFAQLLVRERER